MLNLAAEGFDRGLDDRQRAGRLLAKAFRVGAVGVDADAAGHRDQVTRADGPAVAHDRFPLRTAGSALASGPFCNGDLDVGHDGASLTANCEIRN
jgi:hypothetical protein